MMSTLACNDTESLSFVDSRPSFRIANGSVNPGYVLPDGIHITKAVLNRLTKTFLLKMKDKGEGICKGHTKRQTIHRER